MRVRLSLLALAGLVVASAPTTAARQAAPRSPRNASYELAAQLNPATHGLDGAGRLTWRNISRVPATELRFHLYWNAWRNAASTWIRESLLAQNLDITRRGSDDWARIDLSRLERRADPSGPGQNLLAQAHFIAPDDNNADDRTVLAVPLDRPIPPGEHVDIDMAWTSHVPRTLARTGVIGQYYFIAQWFPKIGVLEDDGTWNCHQFHAATEFFADYGNYDVTLSVPKTFTTGATGRMVIDGLSRLDASGFPAREGFSQIRYIQDDVHDFAWTASPDFVDLHQPFDEPGLPKVDIRLLLQPEHLAQADRHFNAAIAALRNYGRWFGAYPYDHITVVDPIAVYNGPAQGGSTGGMEYPTLFTAGTRYFAPFRGTQPESVTVHEAGHQFWYGVVGTNEFERAWMDEGFNQYSQARTMAETWPGRFVTVGRYFGGLAGWAYDDATWSREVDGPPMARYRAVASYEVESTPTWRYWPAAASATTYSKTALWLETLERHLGWPTMQKIMATHFSRGAFRHPAPDEFFAIAREVSGQELGWFFDQVYGSSAVFDYGVAQVTTTPSGARGYVSDGAAAPFTAGGGGRLDSAVVVRRYGDGVFPIDIRVTFDDGQAVIEHWDGRERWHVLHYRRASPVRSVEVDPNWVLVLDVNRTNNSWTMRPRAAEAARKWSWRWLSWLEERLLTYAFFA